MNQLLGFTLFVVLVGAQKEEASDQKVGDGGERGENAFDRLRGIEDSEVRGIGEEDFGRGGGGGFGRRGVDRVGFGRRGGDRVGFEGKGEDSGDFGSIDGGGFGEGRGDRGDIGRRRKDKVGFGGRKEESGGFGGSNRGGFRGRGGNKFGGRRGVEDRDVEGRGEEGFEGSEDRGNFGGIGRDRGGFGGWREDSGDSGGSNRFGVRERGRDRSSSRGRGFNGGGFGRKEEDGDDFEGNDRDGFGGRGRGRDRDRDVEGRGEEDFEGRGDRGTFRGRGRDRIGLGGMEENSGDFGGNNRFGFGERGRERGDSRGRRRDRDDFAERGEDSGGFGKSDRGSFGRRGGNNFNRGEEVEDREVNFGGRDRGDFGGSRGDRSDVGERGGGKGGFEGRDRGKFGGRGRRRGGFRGRGGNRGNSSGRRGDRGDYPERETGRNRENDNERVSGRGGRGRGRGRPGRRETEKGSKGKKVKKQLYWFQVDGGEFDRCDNVNDTDNVDIKEGSPQKSCKEDNETICLCGKKGEGNNVTRESLMGQKGNWKYLCGECRKRSPFSFKIDRTSLVKGRGKGKGNGKKRPTGQKEGEKSRNSDGWLKTKAGTYKFVKQGKCELACTRAEGKEECKKEGGYLAEINNKEEVEALKEILMKNVNNTQVWLGGVFTGEGKQGWQWEQGKEDIAFNNWGKNQGDGSNKRECMAVDGEGNWWGIHCDLRVSLGRIRPLCERIK